MLRVLFGHSEPGPEGPVHDLARYDVKWVRFAADGKSPPNSIKEMLVQCPAGWRPDVYLHAGIIHFPIPVDVDSFDGLTACLMNDWHRGGRAVWAGAGFFDLITSNRNACRHLEAVGYRNARFCRFWGIDPKEHRLLPGTERDIDILFVGTLLSAVWGERNRWLERVARLSGQYRVMIASSVYGEDYIQLLNRAKIVFNRSVKGETNARTYESMACGALVFNEAENEECREAFEENKCCVYYTPYDLEVKLERFLGDTEARQRIADAGRREVEERHTAALQMNALCSTLEAGLSCKGYRPYASLPPRERDYRRAMQIYGSAKAAAASTALELLGSDKTTAQEARAAVLGWMSQFSTGEQKRLGFRVAIQAARLAVQERPASSIAHMTYGFLLLYYAQAMQPERPADLRTSPDAVTSLQHAADLCDLALSEGRVDNTDITGFGFPRWGDTFDVLIDTLWLKRETDPFTWSRELRRLIAWRCRTELVRLALSSGKREEAYDQARRAVETQPDLGTAWLNYGRSAEALNRPVEAICHYRRALEMDPFAAELWLDIGRLLLGIGATEEASLFIQERRQVSRAAPDLHEVQLELEAMLEAA